MTDQTIFERCAKAIIDLDGRHGLAYAETAAEKLASRYARAVIQTIIDNTPSLRTAEELNRILGEA